MAWLCLGQQSPDAFSRRKSHVFERLEAAATRIAAPADDDVLHGSRYVLGLHGRTARGVELLLRLLVPGRPHPAYGADGG